MGTHNSYHIAPPTSVLTFLTSPIVTGLLGSDADEVPGAWEVTMQPLGQQLGDYGVSRLPARTGHNDSGPVLCPSILPSVSGRGARIPTAWYLQADSRAHQHEK